jgi:MoaA/NifB/PqqE/SkfB family radical SAM enzyme
MKPQKEFSFGDWKRILKDKIFKEVKVVTVSGGEAFLYQDYLKTVKLIVNNLPKLKKIVLNSNGFGKNVAEDILAVAGYCKLKKIKLAVTLSIDEVGEKHDEIRRIKGGFDRAMMTLDKLINSGAEIDLSVASVLMNKNIDRYREINKFFTDKGIGHGFQLIGFHDTYVDNLEEKNNLGFVGADKKKILKFIVDMKNKSSFESFYWDDMCKMYRNNERRKTPCIFLKDGLVIDTIGDVYYCLSAKPIGNFVREKRTISEIYFDPKNIKFRKNLWESNCKYCNSACDVRKSVAYDFKKYLVFSVKRIIQGNF